MISNHVDQTLFIPLNSISETHGPRKSMRGSSKKIDIPRTVYPWVGLEAILTVVDTNAENGVDSKVTTIPKGPDDKKGTEQPDLRSTPGNMQDFIEKLKCNSDKDKPDDVDMSESAKAHLTKLLTENPVLTTDFTDIPPSSGVEHEIREQPGSAPVCKRPYRMSPAELIELRKQLDLLLSKNMIRPSSSPKLTD
mmetsp:Transcript_18149/g.61748  ORF Transcript_18149/g.61748 Transcript_18149/m.61748 type:complete len:194 (-) Transcript_18149:1488-2069(-)